MPSTSALLSLFSQQQISNEMWFELLEERRLLLKPYLDTVTLGTLGQVECLRGSGNDRALGRNSKKLIPGWPCAYDLDLQGIFSSSYASRTYSPGTGYRTLDGTVTYKDGHLYIWGLSRKAQWILARVDFVGKEGYRGRGEECAVNVQISNTHLGAIISAAKVSPRDIWDELSMAVLKWEEQRKKLYEEIRRLSAIVQRDNTWLALAVSR